MTDKKENDIPKEEQTAEEQTEEQQAQEEQEMLLPEVEDEQLTGACRQRICPSCNVMAEAAEERLRALADLDNTRKRLEKEKEDFRKYAGEKVLGDLLPALDNLDLALMHTPDDTAVKNFAMGVEMTRKAMLDALSNHGLTPVGEVGDEFTPEFHEAIGHEEHEGMAANTIAQVMQRGYMLNGRLLRPAKVMVAK